MKNIFTKKRLAAGYLGVLLGIGLYIFWPMVVSIILIAVALVGFLWAWGTLLVD